MEEVLTRWLGTTASLRTEIVAAIGLVLTFGVSVHVLLRKRVVGAAIGWIGLAWLAPVFGTLLYLTFGINRVERRARRLKRRPSQTIDETPQPSAHVPEAYHALDLAVQAVTGLPTVAGNRFELLRNGDEAYPAMLAAIGEARRSVALSSYIFRDDATGRAFCAALKAAQDRGAGCA